MTFPKLRRGAVAGFLAITGGLPGVCCTPRDAARSTGPAGAAPTDCAAQLPSPAAAADPRPLRFGVTAAGQVVTPTPVREDQVKTLDALRGLGDRGPFLVRLNRVFYSKGRTAVRDAVVRARRYTKHGFLVSLQLRYGDLGFEEGTPEGYAAWLRRLVRALGPNERVVGYEVTNEANLNSAPDNSDGSFADAAEALAQGVVAVSEEADRHGFDHVTVGFDWYYEAPVTDDDAFWEALRPHAETLAASLDWVGMTSYPGTYDQVPTPPGQEGEKIIRGLRVLRECRLPALGIGSDVPIRIMENGYSTSTGKDEARQAEALETMVRAASDHAGTYNVTDYNWFTLRDARTGSAQPHMVYGLLTSSYEPKRSYAVYDGLIEELGAAATEE